MIPSLSAGKANARERGDYERNDEQIDRCELNWHSRNTPTSSYSGELRDGCDFASDMISSQSPNLRRNCDCDAAGNFIGNISEAPFEPNKSICVCGFFVSWLLIAIHVVFILSTAYASLFDLVSNFDIGGAQVDNATLKAYLTGPIVTRRLRVEPAIWEINELCS